MDELLKLLRDNALETPENLAKLLGMAEEDVKARIAEYEKNGIICGYRAVVNDLNLCTTSGNGDVGPGPRACPIASP